MWNVIVIRICFTPFRVVSLNPPTVYGSTFLSSFKEFQNNTLPKGCQFPFSTILFRYIAGIFCVHFHPFPASCIYNSRKTDAKRGHRVAVKSLSIRIDSETLDKLHVIAEYEGRSANSQILILIRNCIETYEKEKGIIHGRKRNL